MRWMSVAKNLRDTSRRQCCSQRPNHSAITHPSKKQNGTRRAVSHIDHNSESILGRNDSPLSCLHLALAYRYYFVWRRHDNMPPFTGSMVNTNYEWIASWGGCQWRTRDPRILQTPLASHCCSQRPNHSAMTHPSKNGLAPGERYHTLATTGSRFWARMILHWAAYTWHWVTYTMGLISNYNHGFLWHVIIHPYSYFTGDLAKPPPM